VNDDSDIKYLQKDGKRWCDLMKNQQKDANVNFLMS
jgi:hypothetical protein